MPDKIVNHFVLADGSTAKYSAEQLAGDIPEVVDIRTGYDGTVYASAGDAVRGQVSDLRDDLFASTGNKEIPVTGKNQFIDLSGSSVTMNGGVPQLSGSSASYSYKLVSCSEGDKFTVSGTGGNQTRLWGFVSATGEILLVSSAAVNSNNVLLVAPANAAFLILHNLWDDTRRSYYGELLVNVSDTLIDDIEESQNVSSVDFSTDTNGYFINSLGVKSSNVDFATSAPINVPKHTKVLFKARGYRTQVSMISIYDSHADTYIPLVISTDSNINEYEYTATSDVVLVFSYNKSHVHIGRLVYLNQTADNSLEASLDAVENATTRTRWDDVGTEVSGKQVHVYNGAVDIANASSSYVYRTLDVSSVDKVKIVCQAGTNVNYQIGYVFATSSGAVVSQYNNTSGIYTLEVNVPAGASVLYVNNNGNAMTPRIMTESLVSVSEAEYPYSDLSLFSKFGVVGDSYASGELYYNGAYTDKYAISWGQILARKHGITCTNYSKGGLTTRSWLTDAKGLSLMNSSTAEDLYLLALGINDYDSLGQAYVGDITDITDYASYTDYADTFYGNYGKIIEQIQAHAPHAKIVMFTVASTNTVPALYNDAIIEIAGHYNIPYIVQASDPFFHSDIYTTMSGGHPTAVAYSGMATAFERLLDKCVKNNLAYFFDTFMYN